MHFFGEVSGRRTVPRCASFHVPTSLRLLEIERHRADRAASVFSLLTLTPRDNRSEALTYECLAGILPRRLRITDHIGWLDNRRVGVIFPGTEAAGAWKAADDVCRRFPEGVPTPICAVLSYPSVESSQIGPHPEVGREALDIRAIGADGDAVPDQDAALEASSTFSVPVLGLSSCRL